jgi:hypothetical protein
MTNQPYQKKIEAWRQDMEASLRVEDGWLTVVGLFWLHEGENTFGTDPSNDIVLPPDSAPGRAGSFIHQAGETRLCVDNNLDATIDDEAVSDQALRVDQTGSPSIVGLGDLLMHVLQRGTRYGIRLRDKNSPLLKTFKGRRWYPVQEAYRVSGDFTVYDPPKTIAVPNILGDATPTLSPGFVTFIMRGQEARLDVISEREGRPYFIFKDETSRETTYPAGRFLLADRVDSGRVILDFNQAYNPPCAFTPYATCPLPPPQNHLPLKLEAGERYEGARDKR